MNRAVFKKTVRGFSGFQEYVVSMRFVEWSKEGREAARRRLIRYWEEISLEED